MLRDHQRTGVRPGRAGLKYSPARLYVVEDYIDPFTAVNGLYEPSLAARWIRKLEKHTRELECYCAGVLGVLLLDPRVRQAVPDNIAGPFVNVDPTAPPFDPKTFAKEANKLWNPKLDNAEK
eukprot:1192857-Prorocentrum_minimum.AAC.1